jgi:lipoprotein-releasing system permease protein
MAEPSTDTAPFSAFERMVAWRYLRSRRKEGFISVIAGFSFVGIMLGVATLIIVMAVMNGFRGELITRILASTAMRWWFSRSTGRSTTTRRGQTRFRRSPGGARHPAGRGPDAGLVGAAGTGALVRGMKPKICNR